MLSSVQAKLRAIFQRMDKKTNVDVNGAASKFTTVQLNTG
jgi:hypothetical protein